MTSFDPLEFGRLQERVDNLTETVDRLTKSVDNLNDTLSELRGGRKLIVSVAAIIVAATSALTWLATHVKYTPPGH